MVRLCADCNERQAVLEYKGIALCYLHAQCCQAALFPRQWRILDKQGLSSEKRRVAGLLDSILREVEGEVAAVERSKQPKEPSSPSPARKRRRGGGSKIDVVEDVHKEDVLASILKEEGVYVEEKGEKEVLVEKRVPEKVSFVGMKRERVVKPENSNNDDDVVPWGGDSGRVLEMLEAEASGAEGLYGRAVDVLGNALVRGLQIGGAEGMEERWDAVDLLDRIKKLSDFTLKDNSDPRSRIRSIAFALRQSGNGALRAMLLTSDEGPKNVASLSTEELATPRLKAERIAQQEALVHGQTALEELLWTPRFGKCPKCNATNSLRQRSLVSNKADSRKAETWGGGATDVEQVAEVECTKCKHTFTVRGE